MKIFAHRGFSGKYPENTMLAFNKALECGADGIELDVHLTKDGKPIIIHDEKLERTTGKAGCVCDYNFDEIIKINAPNTFGDTYGFTPIPSFDEYCQFLKKTNLITNIELKTDNFYYNGIEQTVIDMIRKYGLEKQIIFSSFNPFSVVSVKKIAPEIEAAYLIERKFTVNIASILKNCGFEYFHPDYNLLSDESVKNCADYGIRLNVWTVNDEVFYPQAVKWNINGLISNYPDKFLKLTE